MTTFSYFFKHGVWNNFGKISIIEDRFTNQHPTLTVCPCSVMFLRELSFGLLLRTYMCHHVPTIFI